jgi:broad specificity phosphatase PhoE
MKYFASTILIAKLALLSAAAASAPLKNATILIIRHAEKPESGFDLAPEGVQRAQEYVHYFKTFEIDSRPAHFDHLFAAADSKNSHRPRLTLSPLSKASGKPLDLRFKDKNFQGLANDLRATPHGKQILICWHHGAIPELLRSLGADPEKLLPGGQWPETQFGWVIELHYNNHGELVPEKCQRIEEHLMPADKN